jgi:hypothetical protein
VFSLVLWYVAGNNFWEGRPVLKPNVDTVKLRRSVKNFAFHSKPSNGTVSDYCTIRDLRNVIDNLTDVLNAFVDELEREE